MLIPAEAQPLHNIAGVGKAEPFRTEGGEAAHEVAEPANDRSRPVRSSYTATAAEILPCD